MSDFKSEYKQAVNRLEPDGKLLEKLKADMKTAIDAPPKPNFFVRYGWVFGSAAACLVAVAFAAGILLLPRSEELSGGADHINLDSNGAPGNFEMAMDPEESGDYFGGNDMDSAGDCAEDYGIPNDAEQTANQSVSKNSEALEDAPVPEVEAEQLRRLEPLSYQELTELILAEQDNGLTVSDFGGYDHIEEGYFVVLRYDCNGDTYPIAAEFSPSSEHTVSFRLYLRYGSTFEYVDLEKISAEELGNYFRE